MIVFKTTLQIVKKYKLTILLYTLLLIGFTALNFQSGNPSTQFVVEKPDIVIVNHDQNEGITKSLIEYLSTHCYVKDIEGEEKISDALFYRDISYYIEIPQNYRNDFLKGNQPDLIVKSTGDYEASLASMILSEYQRVADVYLKEDLEEDTMIHYIEDSLEKETKTLMTSKLDTTQLSKATFYFNFLNYSILAGIVYVLCLILSSFREKNVEKRTIISSMNYQKFNRQLLLSNSVVALSMWCFYILLSFILIGQMMFSMHGLLYIINSFVFTFCALSLAFFIGHVIPDKNVINGIINVVALGSSFLCGAFVSMDYLPDIVLKVAHILPSYWYIKTNELIRTTEVFELSSIQPMMLNMVILFIFAVIFMIFTQIVSKRKNQIA